MTWFMSWKPENCAPVASSPASCVTALTICCGEDWKMFWKPAGSMPPPAVNASIAVATLTTFCGTSAGNTLETWLNPKVMKTSFGSS